MLEDLFKVVTTRFNGNEKSEKTSAEESNKIPDDLLYKCPRCRNVVFEDESEEAETAAEETAEEE